MKQLRTLEQHILKKTSKDGTDYSFLMHLTSLVEDNDVGLSSLDAILPLHFSASERFAGVKLAI